MNQAIADKERWGKPEIHARADDLTDRAIEIWPGPDESDRDTAPGRDWTLLHNALAVLPPATWTTYGDLAEVIGSHAVPVGVHLANTRVLNAHRVLTADRRPSDSFRWIDEDDDRDVRDVLAAEGVKFDESGRADPGLRVTARELAELLGLPGAEDLGEAELSEDTGQDLSDNEKRFQHQIGERSGPKAAGAVARLLDHWNATGGDFQYGTATNARCSPILRRGRGIIKMLNIYADVAEVPFAFLKARPPFDDPALREELRRRLNTAPGVDLPASKLELYPSFPVTLLADDAVWDVVTATLDWFADQVKKAGTG
jgi:alkylated DNA nucleotide flippase Atl1